MKRLVLLVAISLTAFFANAQELNFNDLLNIETKMFKYIDYTSYTASDGSTIKIGDYVEFGEASGDKNYNYIFAYVPLTTPVKIQSGFNGRKYEVVRITLNGDKENKHVGIWTKTNLGGKYLIDYELAIKYGEVVTNGMTSDKALDELEKEKRKFDLGLISEDEYNQKKSELAKYIK